MATTLQEILERYEHEHASTHAVIAAMPDDHASFRPHERSMSWGQLAWHVATTPLYYVSEVFKLPTQSGWDLDSARPPTTTAGLVQALDYIYDEIVAALRTKDDAWLDDRKTARRCRNTSITKAKETRVAPACLFDAHVHVDRWETVVSPSGARQRERACHPDALWITIAG